MTRISEVNDAIRSMDPADPYVDQISTRAVADLQAILDTEIAPSPRRTTSRRLAPAIRRTAVVGATAVAVTVVTLALPTLLGGDRAFATWTAAPASLGEEARPGAGAECRERMKDGSDVGPDYGKYLDEAEVAIAETRGVWTTVVLVGTDGFSAMCITDDSDHLFSKRMIGSMGIVTDYTAPGPRELIATSLGMGSSNDDAISLVSGHAGEDVEKVVYASVEHGDVVATVSSGHFALWLPGDELEDAPSDGVELEVTYRDGESGTVMLSLG